MTVDIVGIGSMSIDRLLYTSSYPEADTKQQIYRVDKQGGGLTATALVAAVRLGVSSSLIGILGDDEDSNWVDADLRREGLDTSYMIRVPGVTPFLATIIVDETQQTRTILYYRQAPDTLNITPDLTPIASAKVLLFDDADPLCLPYVEAAVRFARDRSMPVVADFETGSMVSVMDQVNHLVVPLHFARKVTGISDPADAALRLWRDDRAVVVVTCGIDGAWYTDDGQTVHHQSVFTVPVVDTTGAGDVFHGAYAAALLWGYSPEERVRFATATSALKVTRPGGRRGIPTRDEVERLIQSSVM